MATDPQFTPVRLDLKRDEKLEIQWQDGRVCVYSISLLRTNCPCAACKVVRQDDQKKNRCCRFSPEIIRSRCPLYRPN